MSSLLLGGDIVKFAANYLWLASDRGPGSGPSVGSNCASTGYFDAPRRYLAVYLLGHTHLKIDKTALSKAVILFVKLRTPN